MSIDTIGRVVCARLQVVCIASSALFLAGGSCQGPGLVAGGATVALVCGASAALLCACVALQLPARAPRAWMLAVSDCLCA